MVTTGAVLHGDRERLVADPHDTRERRAVMADMDAVGSDWPE